MCQAHATFAGAYPTAVSKLPAVKYAPANAALAARAQSFPPSSPPLYLPTSQQPPDNEITLCKLLRKLSPPNFPITKFYIASPPAPPPDFPTTFRQHSNNKIVPRNLLCKLFRFSPPDLSITIFSLVISSVPQLPNNEICPRKSPPNFPISRLFLAIFSVNSSVFPLNHPIMRFFLASPSANSSPQIFRRRYFLL